MRLTTLTALAVYPLLGMSKVHADSGWTDYGTVSELVPSTRHYYQAELRVQDNPSGCKNKTRFYQDYSAMASDKMFELLLESVKSGLKVRVYVTGLCNLKGLSEISAVSVVP